MSFRRSPLPWFELENDAYASASVSVYVADLVTGAATTTLATLYDALTGLGTIRNPLTLGSNGAQLVPIYVDVPVVSVVTGLTGVDRTGAYYPSLSSDDVLLAQNAALAAIAANTSAQQALAAAIAAALQSQGYSTAAANSAAAAAASALLANPILVPSVVATLPSLWVNQLTTTALDGTIAFSRASSGTYTDQFGNANVAPINAPRFDFSATGAALGLLLRPVIGGVQTAPDRAVVPVSNTIYQAAEGALLVEFDVLTLDNTVDQVIADLSDGTALNRFKLSIDHGVVKSLVVSAGVPIASLTHGAVTANLPHRLMLSWGAFGFRSCFDNGAVVVAGAGAFPIGVANLYLGSDGPATAWLNGHLRHVGLFPRALTATLTGNMTDPARGLDVYDAESLVPKFAVLNALVLASQPGFDPNVMYLTG